MEDIIIRYPQVDLYLKKKHLLEAKDLFRDSEGNEREEVDVEGFKLALSHVDSQMKSLPATAQVLLPLFRLHVDVARTLKKYYHILSVLSKTALLLRICLKSPINIAFHLVLCLSSISYFFT